MKLTCAPRELGLSIRISKMWENTLSVVRKNKLSVDGKNKLGVDAKNKLSVGWEQ